LWLCISMMLLPLSHLIKSECWVFNLNGFSPLILVLIVVFHVLLSILHFFHSWNKTLVSSFTLLSKFQNYIHYDKNLIQLSYPRFILGKLVNCLLLYINTPWSSCFFIIREHNFLFIFNYHYHSPCFSWMPSILLKSCC